MYLHQLLKYAGWTIEVVIGLIAIHKGTSILRNVRSERSELRAGMPDIERLRNRSQPLLDEERDRRFPIMRRLVQGLRNRLLEGRFQEDAILAELDQDIFSRGDVLRDCSTLAILVALLFTFVTLSITLFSAGNNPNDGVLKTAVTLVGVNWPGLLAGIVAFGLGSWVRSKSASLFDEYREWLHRSVFPYVGSAGLRDDLQASLRQFTVVCDDLVRSLGPLATLPADLERFQRGAINTMTEALTQSLRQVPLALSDATIVEIRKAAGHSRELLEQVARDYAKLVLITEAEERRQAELAEAILDVCGVTRECAGELGDLRTTLRNSSEWTVRLAQVLASVETHLSVLETPVTNLEIAATKNSEALSSLNAVLTVNTVLAPG